jgi:hypothetical protein
MTHPVAGPRELHAESRSVAETGHVMGLRPRLVVKIFRRAGVTVIRARRWRKNHPEMLASELIEQGRTLAETAATIRASQQSLRTRFRREGINKVRLWRRGPKGKASPDKPVRARGNKEKLRTIGSGSGACGPPSRARAVRYRRRRSKMTPAGLARARKLVEQGSMSETAAVRIIGVGSSTIPSSRGRRPVKKSSRCDH